MDPFVLAATNNLEPLCSRLSCTRAQIFFMMATMPNTGG
jgi:hypothetical protein